MDAKWNTYGKLDLETTWNTHIPCDLFFPKKTCIHCAGSDSNISFAIGQERELLVRYKSQLSALSPMFDVMIEETGAKDLQDAPKTTDNFQVAPLVHQNFRFLLCRDPCGQDAEHLPKLTEITHHGEKHRQFLPPVPKHGGRVLSSPTPPAAQLCYSCLRDVVPAQHLPQIPVCHPGSPDCNIFLSGRDPSWEEWRSASGEGLHTEENFPLPDFTLLQRSCSSSPVCSHNGAHKDDTRAPSGGVEVCQDPCTTPMVPDSVLTGSELEKDRSSSSSFESPSLCLLKEEEEVEGLVPEGRSQFPAKIREKRRRAIPGGVSKEDRVVSRRRTRKQILLVGLVILLLLFAFLLQYVLLRFLVGPTVHDMNKPDTSSERAGNETYYS
ncbi:hypothetical protein ACOMHN_042769 [Nucella lapillus]